VPKSETESPRKAVRKHAVTRRILLATALSAPLVARAQAYPDRPIRVIVPGAPGGMVDLAARAIGDGMHRELGQAWLVDSRPGANGVIAARAFLDAPADGHTLYLTVLGHVLLPFLVRVPFDVIADFQPVAMIGSSTFLLCVPASSPADTVAGFVAYAQSRSRSLNYLNPGNGTVPHLLPEMLKIRYGLDMASIYYKGVQQGISDLVAGDLDLGLLNTGLVQSHVQQGRLKAIAQVSRHRINALPGVATLAEQGLADLAIETYLPLYGRASMSAPAVARVNRAIAAALADQATRTRLAAAHIEPLPMQPAEVGATMQREHDRLGAVIRQLGIKADGAT
jgi:tripartite-type tricarboxylate transporter receptor subunit TctC